MQHNQWVEFYFGKDQMIFLSKWLHWKMHQLFVTILFLYEINQFMEAWISSRVRPFVSGTSMTMNTTAAAQTNAYPKNVPERPYRLVDIISLTKFYRTPRILKFGSKAWKFLPSFWKSKNTT